MPLGLAVVVCLLTFGLGVAEQTWAQSEGSADRPSMESSADISADDAAHGSPAAGHPRAGRQRRTFVIDFEMSLFRLGLAVAGLGLFAWGMRARRSDPSARVAGLRLAILLGIAATSFGSYYYFFVLGYRDGLDAEDGYLYYIGSKYSPELGYFELYNCTLFALVEDGSLQPDSINWIRDLRTHEMLHWSRALARGRRCQEHFTPERWQQFKGDVGWFQRRMTEDELEHVLGDHGYHPGPVWTLIARPLSTLLPIERDGPQWLARGDPVLAALIVLVVSWAFGLEAGGVVAILWGTGYLWRYSWIGGSYFRLLWLASAVVGVCVARKRYHAASGAFLTLSALLRVFPAAFGLGYLLLAIRRTWSSRRAPAWARRFVAGSVVALVVLGGASIWVAGRGPAVYLEFTQKITGFQGRPGFNKVGLEVLAYRASRWLDRGSDGRVEREGARAAGTGSRWSVGAVRVVQLAVVLLFLGLFWRALAHAEPWEAAALGFTLIPMLSQPTNYYYGFVLMAALLGTQRPRITVLAFLACIAWIVNGLFFYLESGEFAGASAIAVVFCFLVVLEMGRPAAGGLAAATDGKQPRLGGASV